MGQVRAGTVQPLELFITALESYDAAKNASGPDR